MVKNGLKIPSFCLAKIRPHVRVRSPTIQLKENVNSSKTNDKKPEDSNSLCNKKETISKDIARVDQVAVKIVGRKVMIVVDPSVEAKNALQWALSHAVHSHDILVLLYVKKITSKQGNALTKEKATKLTGFHNNKRYSVPGFLCCMKNACEIKHPDVQVEISIVEGKEKGATIVEEAKKQGVTMLVLGQKKQPITWRLFLTWSGRHMGGSGGGMVDYCVQNVACMAVAVRKKSKRVGGYVITTKRQKDFWLLA